MSMNDLVSDFVARINNARLAKLNEVVVRKTRMIIAIAKKLTAIGYLHGFEEGSKGELVLNLNLDRISAIKRVSKPGQRVYVAATESPKVIGGRGYSILTTSQGIFTHIEAAKNKAGGEVLFQIY